MYFIIILFIDTTITYTTLGVEIRFWQLNEWSIKWRVRCKTLSNIFSFILIIAYHNFVNNFFLHAQNFNSFVT